MMQQQRFNLHAELVFTSRLGAAFLARNQTNRVLYSHSPWASSKGEKSIKFLHIIRLRGISVRIYKFLNSLCVCDEEAFSYFDISPLPPNRRRLPSSFVARGCQEFAVFRIGCCGKKKKSQKWIRSFFHIWLDCKAAAVLCVMKFDL